MLEALLELRLRLPTLYHLEPKLLLIDTQSFHVTLIPSDDLFSRKSPHPSQSKDDLRFISPEELGNDKRELTTICWTLGIMMYEAHFKRNPFTTCLNSKVMN